MVSAIASCKAAACTLGVLANVERVQMKAKGAHLQDERVDEGAGDAQAAVGGQRGAQRLKVVEKLIDGTVSGQHLRQLVLPLRQGIWRYGQRPPWGRDAPCVRCTRAFRQMTKRR